MKQFRLVVIGLAAAASFATYGCGKGDMIGGCSSSNDCPHPTLFKCDSARNACLELNPPHCSDGKQNGDETDINCGGSCRPCGAGQACKVNADCSTNKCKAGTCVFVTCTSDEDCDGTGHSCDTGAKTCNTCSDGKQNGDETDIDCGSVRTTGCDKCTIGRHCVKNADCDSSNCGDDGLCAAAKCNVKDECGDAELCIGGYCVSCKDKVMNGHETDEDCGGPDCNKCAEGRSCGNDDDCDGELACVGLVCTDTSKNSCTNKVKDDNESDIDCGGTSGCGPCKQGQSCAKDEDCDAPLKCVRDKCGPDSCTNKVKDENETGIDCGGASGCGLCPVDQPCAADSDCVSWNCVSSLCAAGECKSAAAGEILINEVFTNPKADADMHHSASKQMKYVELLNATSEKRFLKDLKIDFTDAGGKTKTVSMAGCIEPQSYLVLYPQGQSLTALDIDAKSAANGDLDAAMTDASACTVRLVSRGTGATVHGAKLPDMSGAQGVSAARKDSGAKEGDLDVFVPHNTIPADGGADNPYSPGLPNNIGIPQG